MASWWVEQIKLRALAGQPEAQVAMASVPVPKDEQESVIFDGIPAQAVPIAWYPGTDGPGAPRRLLLLGASDIALPEEIGLRAGEPVAVTPGGYALPERGASGATGDDATGWSGPRWQLTILDEKKTGLVMHETNELVLTHRDREIGLRMGVQLDDAPGLRWWEFVQVEELWAGPICRAIRAGGYIGITEITDDNWCDPVRYNHGEWFHKHNWLHAEIYALIFANGLVKITARHINNRFFDHGRDLEGFVPVMGFRQEGEEGITELALDGAQTDFALGGVQLDLSGSTGLFGPENPGRLSRQDGVLVFQPYEGVEFILNKGDFTVEAQEHHMLKGMGRTFACDLSFADAPIRTARYLPPYGWMGYAEALWPDAALPVHGEMDAIVDKEREYFHYDTIAHRFNFPQGDGEFAHGTLREAHRTHEARLYTAGIHQAYAFADIYADHSDYTVRIDNMPQDSMAMPLQRVIGLTSAYLETGDPYLLRVAASITDVAYGIDRSNWPRRSYGRDGAYIRSLIALYHVTGESMYLRRAGDACRHAAQCQRPDGSFGDQGGAYGAHSQSSEIIKPWMNAILSEALAEYLDHAGDDAMVEQAVVRCADWLMSQLAYDEDGAYWPYEIAWGENETPPYLRFMPEKPKERHPAGEAHLDYFAFTLLWVSRVTGDPRYARAWWETCERFYGRKQEWHTMYDGVKAIQNIPWHQAHLWNARWQDGKLQLAPQRDLLAPGQQAEVELPDGTRVRVIRTEDGVV